MAQKGLLEILEVMGFGGEFSIQLEFVEVVFE